MSRYSIPQSLAVALGLAFTMTVLPACDSSESEEPVNSPAAAASENGDLEARIEDYRVAMQQDLGQIDRQLELLDDRAADLTGETREAYDAAIEEIKEQRNQIELALVELEASTMAAWYELKGGLDGDWEDLEEAVAAAGRQFGIGGPDPQSPELPDNPEN